MLEDIMHASKASSGTYCISFRPRSESDSSQTVVARDVKSRERVAVKFAASDVSQLDMHDVMMGTSRRTSTAVE